MKNLVQFGPIGATCSKEYFVAPTSILKLQSTIHGSAWMIKNSRSGPGKQSTQSVLNDLYSFMKYDHFRIINVFNTILLVSIIKPYYQNESNINENKI